MLFKERSDGCSLYPFSFPVNNPYVEDTLFPAGLQILLNNIENIFRTKGVQVQNAVKRDKNRVIRHDVSPARPEPLGKPR